MHTKESLINDLITLGVEPSGTLLVHSSMKAIGDVEGGADAVLDAFITLMAPGLLVFPTHTWSKIGAENPVCDLRSEPSCVGLLTNLFMKRPGVLRSWHPTHSVAAIGVDAADFIAGNELCDTPCARRSPWGKLYDRKAKILFLGCLLRTNTFIHGVEEWNDIPNRLTDTHQQLAVITPDGQTIAVPSRRHECPVGDVSANYAKLEVPLLRCGIARKGKIGGAVSVLCDAVGAADLTSRLLARNVDLFGDDHPVPPEWYEGTI